MTTQPQSSRPRALVSEMDEDGRETKSHWLDRDEAAMMLKACRRSGRMNTRTVYCDHIGRTIGRNYLAPCLLVRTFTPQPPTTPPARWTYSPKLTAGYITFADGREVYLQGDEAADLDAELDACDNARSRQIILDQYEEIASRATA